MFCFYMVKQICENGGTGDKWLAACDKLLKIFPLVFLSFISEALRRKFCFSLALCLLSHLTPTQLFIPAGSYNGNKTM